MILDEDSRDSFTSQLLRDVFFNDDLSNQSQLRMQSRYSAFKTQNQQYLGRPNSFKSPRGGGMFEQNEQTVEEVTGIVLGVQQNLHLEGDDIFVKL